MQTTSKKHLRKSLIWVVVLSCTTLIVGDLYFKIDPIGFRRHVFQPIRELRLLTVELKFPFGWRNTKKVILADAEKKFFLKSSDGLMITADLYKPDNVHPTGAVLLLHGSAPWGRKAGLIRLLASRLKEIGYLVLAPNARGFGNTQDSKQAENPEFWSVRGDLRKCIDYLFSYLNGEDSKIFAVGHSLGAGHTLEGCLDDKRVRAFVLIGPPRYLGGPVMSRWERIRFSADRNLNKPITNELAAERIKETDIKNYITNKVIIERRRQILLIDGELEGKENLDYLKAVSKKMGESVVHITLPQTNHYFGVWNLYGSKTVCFRPDVFDPLLEAIQDFFEKV